MVLHCDDNSLPRVTRDHCISVENCLTACKSEEKANRQVNFTAHIVHLEAALRSLQHLQRLNEHREICDDEHRYEIRDLNVSYETITALRSVRYMLIAGLELSTDKMHTAKNISMIMRLEEIDGLFTDLFVKECDARGYTKA